MDADFAELAARYRRELHVHCYRMLASFDEAEDMVQEVLLRAWRGRDRFDGAEPRAWLYRIATNACLDTLRGRARRLGTVRSLAEVPWLQPYPDRLLDEIAPREAEPDAVAVARETIELAFLASIQLLPPRQRAALILCDVLGWPARDTAALLDTSVAAVNSALQRARGTLRGHLPRSRADWSASRPTAEELAVLRRYVDAHESGTDLPELVHDDVRVTMPPHPLCHDGRQALAPLLQTAVAMGEWRLVPTSANRLPAAACYLRRPGETGFHAFKLDVLRVRDGAVAEFTTFGAQVFPAFGLELSL